MRKIILVALCAASTFSIATAKDEPLKDLTDMQNFYYEKGYRDASEKFYKAGYEKAIMDLIGRAEKYRSTINAYEAGKYYMQSGKITFPKVYRTRNANGEYVVHIDMPEVKEQLSLEDLFVLPDASVSVPSSTPSIAGSSSTSSAFSMSAGTSPAKKAVNMNTIYSVGSDKDKVVNSPISQMREFGVEFPKTQRIKAIFDGNNVKYVETPNQYKAYFKNEGDFRTFCKNTSGDDLCANLQALQ